MAIYPTEMGLDPALETDILSPTNDGDPDYTEWDIAQSFDPTDTVGVVLPAFGGYTVSPYPSTTPDLDYDVSGCWGPDGAIVFAQAGLYSFVALGSSTSSVMISAPVKPAADDGPIVKLIKGLIAKAKGVCFTDPGNIALGQAASYTPKQTSDTKTLTGRMIGDDNDKVIQLAMDIFDSRGLPYKKVGGGGVNTAAQDMATNIDAVYQANLDQAKNKVPISALEVGHGGANGWENKGSFFTSDLTNGNVTADFNALMKGTNGEVRYFDLISCYVALGNEVAGPSVDNHVQTLLAKTLVPAAGTAVTTRAVNVPIYAIAPSKKRVGAFALKDVEPKSKKATEVEVTCSGKPVTCLTTTSNLFP